MRTIFTRIATGDDIPHVASLACAAHAISPMAAVPWNGPRFTATLVRILASDDGLVLVVVEDGRVVGALAAMVVPHWCLSAPAATTLGVFAPRDREGGVIHIHLLRGFRRWAQELDVPPELQLCSALNGVESTACRAAGFVQHAGVFHMHRPAVTEAQA